MNKKVVFTFFLLVLFKALPAVYAAGNEGSGLVIGITDRVSGEYNMTTVSKSLAHLLAGWKIRNQSDIDLGKKVLTAVFTDRTRLEVANAILKPLGLTIAFYQDINTAVVMKSSR